MYRITTLDRIALALVVVGALNWGLVGLLQFDLVATLFGGESAMLSRLVYIVVGAAGLWSITLLFRGAARERVPA
jgi:uncharacterized membrane protein YuzA (DUF378 family)